MHNIIIIASNYVLIDEWMCICLDIHSLFCCTRVSVSTMQEHTHAHTCTHPPTLTLMLKAQWRNNLPNFGRLRIKTPMHVLQASFDGHSATYIHLTRRRRIINEKILITYILFVTIYVPKKKTFQVWSGISCPARNLLYTHKNKHLKKALK